MIDICETKFKTNHRQSVPTALGEPTLLQLAAASFSDPL
jgi:hypothetical protein